MDYRRRLKDRGLFVTAITMLLIAGCIQQQQSLVVKPFILSEADSTAKVNLEQMNEWLAICQSTSANYWDQIDAATHLSNALETERLVELCESLSFDAAAWRIAFGRLDTRPKQQVIDYIVACAKCEHPTAKFSAYAVAHHAAWPELIDCAKVDWNNEALSPPFVKRSVTDDRPKTVGDMAQLYYYKVTETKIVQ